MAFDWLIWKRGQRQNITFSDEFQMLNSKHRREPTNFERVRVSLPVNDFAIFLASIAKSGYLNFLMKVKNGNLI